MFGSSLSLSLSGVCVSVCNMVAVCQAIMVARLQYLSFCLFEMYVIVVFVIRCLCSAIQLLGKHAIQTIFFKFDERLFSDI